MNAGTPITSDWTPPGIDHDRVARIPGWFPPPEGFDAICKVYGAVSVVYDDAGHALVQPDGWEPRNLVLTYGLPGLPRGGRLYVNRKIEPILRDALTEWMTLGIDYPIVSCGCFAPRAKRTSPTAISLHTHAVAIDFNAAKNPLTAPGAPRVTDMPQEFVSCFTRRGFTWGGMFRRSKDSMHLQFCSGW